MLVVSLEPPDGCCCQLCGGELYVYESCYVLDGRPVCTDCLPAYAADYFRDRRISVADYLEVAP